MSLPSLSPQHLSPENSDALFRLARALRRAQGGFSLFLPVCDDPALRDHLINHVSGETDGTTTVIQLDSETRDPFAHLLSHPTSEPRVVHIIGLEHAIPEDQSNITPIAAINLNRDALRTLKCPVVFWLPDYLLTLLHRMAPDFCNWRSDNIAFTSDAPAQPVQRTTQPLTAFISGTIADLRQHRAAVALACRQVGLATISIEDGVARDLTGLETCLEALEKADLFIGIYAWRYGWVPPGSDISIAEIEFNRALHLQKLGRIREIHVFFMDEDHPVPRSAYELDSTAQQKLASFKDRISRDRIRKNFTTPEDLAHKVSEALHAALPRIHRAPAVALIPDILSSADKYHRRALAEHAPANLDAFFRDSTTISHGRITIADLFVEPHLAQHHTRPLDTRIDREDPTTEREELTRQRELPAAPCKPALSTIAEHEHIVILGDPGSGKTTLLRHSFLLALEKWHTEPDIHPFPFFLRLSEWDRSGLEPDFDLISREYLGRYNLPASHIQIWLGGPVAFFLDGIDEIRDALRRQLLYTALTFRFKGNPADRYLVSSRPSGYTPGTLDAAWAEFDIQPLDDAQALLHLQKWEALLLAIEGRSRHLPSLLPELLAHPGLSHVARNALFLHLIVFFHRSNMRLPDDRNDFYQYATSVLSERWIRTRSGNETVRPIAFLGFLLPSLAIHMMRHGLVTVTESELRELTTQRLLAAGYSKTDTDQQLPSFIAAARDFIGVIVDKGGDRFGFLHLSFQEFYAADYLLKAREKEYTEIAARHWDDLDWAEVWQLHLSAADGDTDRRELLHETAKANVHPTLDEALLRCHLTRLKWAGYAGDSRCALEDESVQWAVGRIGEWGNRSYCEELCAILTKWERDLDAALRDALHQQLNCGLVFRGCEAIIPALAAQPLRDAKLTDELFAKLNSDDTKIGIAAAKALATMSKREDAQATVAAQPHTIPQLHQLKPHGISRELLARFQSCDGWSNESGALAVALSSLVGANPSFCDSLIKHLGSIEGHEIQRSTLAYALGEHIKADLRVRTAFLRVYKNELWDDYVRATWVEQLSKLAGEDVEVRDALFERFDSVEEEGYEDAALIEALGPLAGTDKRFRDTLIDRLRSGESEDHSREALVRVLGRLASGDGEVKTALLERFGVADIDRVERGALVQSLTPLAVIDNSVRIALLKLFDTDGLGSYERHILAHEVGKLAQDFPEVKSSVLKRFNSHQGDADERRGLAQGLAPLALRDAGVRSVLIARIKADSGLHEMSVTTAMWRVLRVDRLSQA